MFGRMRVFLAAALIVALAFPAAVSAEARPRGGTRLAPAAEEPFLGFEAADVPGNDSQASAEALNTSNTLVSGSLSDTDDQDVYFVDLTAGQKLAVWMSANAADDFDLYLATPVTGEAPIAASENDAFPEAFTVVAPATGRYYVYVTALAGVGGYSMRAKIESPNPDEEVPGIALPASGSTASLNPYGDQDDFYAVDLTEGQKFSAKLTGAAGTDFNLWLYPPETTMTVASPVVWGSHHAIYPESFTYVVPATGTYYLDVEAKYGSGSYTLSHKTATATADDDIAGLPLPASPLAGWLDSYGDSDDVFGVAIGAGESLRFKLTGPATADYDVYVFGPDAPSVFAAEPDFPTATEPPSETSNESGLFTPSAEATYYVDMYSAFGSGSYSFSYSVGEQSVLKFAGPTVIPFGGVASFSGSLTETDTTPRAGEQVRFQRRPYGSSTWTTVATASVDASGAYSFSAKPAIRTDYRAYFDGEPGEKLSYASSMVTVKPRVSVSRPWAPTSVRRGTSFLTAGYVKPRQSSGSKTIRVYAQRYESGKWVTRRVYTAANSNYSTYSRYKTLMSLPSSGRWRLIAISRENSKNAYSKSSYRYLSVR